MKDYLDLILKGKLEQAEKVRLDDIPCKLVKFYSLTDDKDLNDLKKLNESKFKALEEEQIYFSPVKSLNDPLEFGFMFLDKNRILKHGYSETQFSQLKNQLDNSSNLSVSSFTANNFENLAMWAYYSNNHKGYCVEYEVFDAKKIYKVYYEDSRIPISSIFLNLKKYASEHSEEAKQYFDIFKHQFLVKHISWKHENEYRILVFDEKKEGGFCSINDLGLKTSKIIAGMHCPEEHFKKLQKISKNLSCGDVKRIGVSENAGKFVEV